MSDALTEARQSLETYEDRINRERRYPDLEEASYRLTMMRSAVAQAAALERIADALDNISGAYSIDLPAR